MNNQTSLPNINYTLSERELLELEYAENYKNQQQTLENGLYYPTVISLWLVCLAEIYILISLLCYSIISFKKPLKGPRSNKPRRNHIILIVLLMLVAVFGIITNVVWQFTIISIMRWDNSKSNNNTPERVSKQLESIFYDFGYPAGLTCHFSFLWMRQHVLYSEPSMKPLVSKHMIRFSKIIIIFIVMFGMAMITVYVIFTYTIGIFISTFLSFIYQTSILFCFCYILRRHQAEMSRFPSGSIQSRITSLTSLNKLIRNCCIATSISLAIDSVTVAVSVWAFMNLFVAFTPQVIFIILAQTDFLVNLICDIFCFSAWKRILFPWTCGRQVCQF